MANTPKRHTTPQRSSLSAAAHGLASGADSHTFAGFARQVIGAMPPTGVLDAASQGVWGVAEQAGLLAGAWRRHRNFMQDLDVEAVAGILGELLVAVAQTAQALGVSLDDVAQQQVARAPAPTSSVRATTRRGRHSQPLGALSHGASVASSAQALPTPRSVPDRRPPTGQAPAAPAAPRDASLMEAPRKGKTRAKTAAKAAASAERMVGKSAPAVSTPQRLGRPSADAQKNAQKDAQELPSPLVPRLAQRSRRTGSSVSAPASLGAPSVAPSASPASPSPAERQISAATSMKGKRTAAVPPALVGARTAPRTPRARSAHSPQAPQAQEVSAPSATTEPVPVVASDLPRTMRRRRSHAADQATT